MSKVSLYVVGTPIGNLSDLSERAKEVLASVDFVAAEDTRKSGILLTHFGIKKPLVSYYEHNLAERGEEIIARLKAGETCALISDAGMPAISDPGELLVKQCYENDLVVSAIPGPCAAVTALAISGLPTGRFCFEGFLSTAENSRREHLLSLVEEPRTMIFYEAPHHLLKTLKSMLSILGNRRISLVREMTKIYEEVRLTTLEEAVAYYAENQPRGEFVLIVAGEKKVQKAPDEVSLKEMFEAKLKEGKPRSQAAKELAAETGLSKRDIYERFKENKDGNDCEL